MVNSLPSWSSLRAGPSPALSWARHPGGKEVTITTTMDGIKTTVFLLALAFVGAVQAQVDQQYYGKNYNQKTFW